ncbi:MAG: hypothetical protein ACI9D0_000013 [Bacteroidia bacterium]|jgi:hypothetical protein
MAVAAAALGAAFVSWFQASAVNSLLFIELGFAERTARHIDSVAAVALCLCAVVVCLPVRNFVRVTSVSAALIGLWFLALAIGDYVMQGTAFAHLALPAAALRIATPLLLALVLANHSSKVELGLRVAVATTFAVHGYEALCHNPKFLDLILLNLNPSAESPLFSEYSAGIMLNIIGALDLLVAAGLLFLRSPLLAGYMAIWGAVTALSRSGAMGLEAWPAVVIRSSHVAAPLALFLLWRSRGIMKR